MPDPKPSGEAPADVQQYLNPTKQYGINEIFLSLQGEGARAGSLNVFVRFAGCNLRCTKEGMGFDCDTEFVSRTLMTAQQIAGTCATVWERWGCSMRSDVQRWIVLTGGEPALQLDKPLIDCLHSYGWKLAIETNGTLALPSGVDYVTVSPKTAEHTLRQKQADELKYVRAPGQGIPKPSVTAPHLFLSPAFEANMPNRDAFDWCYRLVKENPEWRMSVQQHKLWQMR